MARYITLKLVNEQGTPHPWPGTATSFEIGSQLDARKVWIGVSADGSNNQIYPLTTTPEQIIAAGWPRVYQGVQLSLLSATDDSPATVGSGEYVYSNSLEDFNRLVAACCIAERVEGSPSPSGPCMVTIFYDFQEDPAGSFVITADGEEVLNITDSATGSVQVPAGSEVIFTVDSTSESSLQLYEGQDSGGNLIDSISASAPNDSVLTLDPAECAQDYFIAAFTSIPPP